MKILRRDLKHGIVNVQVQTLDDLWHLYNVIEKDDMVSARTTREVKMNGVGRPQSRRVPVTLTLKVERVYFDKTVARLRVLGVVTEAPEDLHIQGSHHTLSVGVEHQVAVAKGRWHRHQLDRLERAVTQQEPIIVVSMDLEEACVAVLRSSGLEVKALIRSRLPGKREVEKRESALGRYYSDVLGLIASFSGDLKGKIVVVGPGFAKERFAAFVKDRSPDVAARIVAVKSVGNAGEAGAYEAIRCGVLSKTLRDMRAIQEASAMEEVLKRLGSSKGDVSYSLEQVSKDASEGAVESILICDQILREASEEKRRLIDETIRSVEGKGGKVLVVSSEHEGGAKLNSLGGVAALLRYAKHR